jgi:hypothetical protein
MHCRSTKPDGKPCKAPAVKGRDFCVFHDPSPDSARCRSAGRRKGGSNRKVALKVVTLPPDTLDAPLATVADVVALLGRTINSVMTGKLSVGVGHCVSQLASTLLKALEGDEVERELAEWRAEKEKRKSRRMRP